MKELRETNAEINKLKDSVAYLSMKAKYLELYAEVQKINIRDLDLNLMELHWLENQGSPERITNVSPHEISVLKKILKKD